MVGDGIHDNRRRSATRSAGAPLSNCGWPAPGWSRILCRRTSGPCPKILPLGTLWPARYEEFDRAGRTVYHVESLGAPRSIWVIRNDAVVAIGCVVFLISAVGVWWKGHMGWRINCGVLSLAAAFAMLVPAWLAPVGSGLFLGIVSGRILIWTAFGPPRRTSTSTVGPPRTIAAGVGAIAARRRSVARSASARPIPPNREPHPMPSRNHRCTTFSFPSTARTVRKGTMCSCRSRSTTNYLREPAAMSAKSTVAW